MTVSDATAGPPPRPPAFLGADVGGSRTTVVVVAADGTELARAVGAGAAIRGGTTDRAAAAIVAITRGAVERAGRGVPLAGALIGAAGAGREPERSDLQAALDAADLATAVRVIGDVELALQSAFGDGPGIVIAAGTGSAAFARDPAGALHRAGGYGWQLGDEGGGYALGRRALGLVSRARDGIGDAGTLPGRILSALSLASFDDLVRWAARATTAEVAGLAGVVLAAARQGDGAADALVQEAASELVALVTVLARRFPPATRVGVAPWGGLLTPQSALRAALEPALRATALPLELRPGTLDPALTAARLAARG